MIINGCDGDYNDEGEVGSCDYVDTCQQFGSVEPTLSPVPTPEITVHPTTEPTVLPTNAPTVGPTQEPTSNPVEEATYTQYELVLRGVYGNFQSDADDLAEGDMSALALMAIAEALDYAANPELESEVTVTVESVDRPKVTVVYTMEGMNVDHLITAIALLDGKVSAGDKFIPQTKKYKYYTNTEVVGFTSFDEFNQLFEDVDESWTISQVLVLIVVVLAGVTLAVFFIVSGYSLWRMYSKRQQQMMEAEVQMSVAAPDLETPLTPIDSEKITLSPKLRGKHIQMVPSGSILMESELQDELDQL